MSPTSPSPWHLASHLAHLRIGRLGASLDLLRPAAGLADWHGLNSELPDFRILAMQLPSFRAGQPQALAEAYLRGRDLIAAYRATADWPVFLHATWRALPAGQPPGTLAAIDLIVTARTELPDARPAVSIRSVLPAAEVLRLSEAQSAAFEPWGSGAGPARATLPSDQPACVLFRPPSGHLSYAELAHPAEVAHSELTEEEGEGRQLAIRHRLFAQPLEKGVLLQARVRGLFVLRQNDASAVAMSYRAFVSAEPPLGP